MYQANGDLNFMKGFAHYTTQSTLIMRARSIHPPLSPLLCFSPFTCSYHMNKAIVSDKQMNEFFVMKRVSTYAHIFVDSILIRIANGDLTEMRNGCSGEAFTYFGLNLISND